MAQHYRELFRQSKQTKDWKPFEGKWKVIKLPNNAGQTPEMTIEEYRKLHPEQSDV